MGAKGVGMRSRSAKRIMVPAAAMAQVAALAVALLLAGPIRAQEPGRTASAAEPIPVSAILARADTDERYAEKVTLDAAGPDPTARLLPELDAIVASIDEKQRALVDDSLYLLPVSRLESLARHWRFDARRVERWREDVRRAMAPYGEYAAQLAQRRAAWEATRAAGAIILSPAMTARVETVTSRLSEAEQALSVPLIRQIELGRRANAIAARVEAGLGNVTAAIDAIDGRLLRIDAPPLWRRGGESPLPDFRTRVRRALQIESSFVRDFVATNAGHLRELALAQLMMLPLLLWLSHYSRRLPATTTSPDTLRILKRPVSMWLLLSMMVLLIFERELPLLMQRLALLIALVPVLRLVPLSGRKLLGAWPYIAAVLYLLQHAGTMTLASTPVYRYFIFGLGAVALGLLALQKWRSHRRPEEQQRPAAVRAAAWVGIVLLLAGCVSTTLGNTSLGETLTTGTINSGYFGLMVYTGTAVMVALLRLLLAQLGRGQPDFTHSHASPLVKVLVRVLFIGAAFGWVVYSLHAFRIYRPAYAFLKELLSREFNLGSLSLTLGDLLVFLVAATIAFWSARIVRLLLRDEILARMSLPRGVAESVSSLTYYVLILLGFLGALAAAGFNVSQLTLVFGALGVGIGFGLQNVVNNFVSGLILMFERPLRSGDFVEVSGISGRVLNIGMRATTIGTPEGAEVVVPNGTLLAGNLVNWTLLDTNRRIEVPVGVAYGSDPDKVTSLIREAAAGTPGIASQPAPVVLFQGLGDSSLKFLVQAWTQDFDRWIPIRSDLYTRVYSALEQAGFEIPFPQQDLHLRSISDEVAASLRPSEPRVQR